MPTIGRGFGPGGRGRCLERTFHAAEKRRYARISVNTKAIASNGGVRTAFGLDTDMSVAATMHDNSQEITFVRVV